MCIMLYMASDHPLPEIPWDTNNPAFFVTSKLDPNPAGILSIFTKRYVYQVGTSHYCGCGFSYSDEEEYKRIYEDDSYLLAKALTENAEGRENLRLLREYLETVVEHGNVELYASTSGGVTEPRRRRQVDTCYFTGEECGIGYGDFLTVCKSVIDSG